jgi:hypothetical protein
MKSVGGPNEERRIQEQRSNTCDDEADVTAFPRSLIKFQLHFPDEAGRRYLFKARWPDGFVGPGYGSARACGSHTKSWIWESIGCHRQTSGSRHNSHHSKLSLAT